MMYVTCFDAMHAWSNCAYVQNYIYSTRKRYVQWRMCVISEVHALNEWGPHETAFLRTAREKLMDRALIGQKVLGSICEKNVKVFFPPGAPVAMAHMGWVAAPVKWARNRYLSL